MSFDDFAKFVADYDLESVSKLSGVPKDKLEKLAQIYAGSGQEGGLLLDHGVQPAHPWRLGQQPLLQHPPADRQDLPAGLRSLLLTGQPSACGTAREVGTFAHRLPAGHGGHGSQTPRHRREDLEAAGRHHPEQVGYHAVLQNRMLKDGKLNAYWVMCNNNMQAGPNMNERGLPGYRNPANFIVVSDPYPDRDRPGGRPHPAHRHVGGKEGPTATPSVAPSSGTSR